MSTISEIKPISEVVKWEVGIDVFFCREKKTVKDGEELVVGSICETAAGKKIALATAANADSICLENSSPVGADGQALFLVRGPAVINKNALNYHTVSAAPADAALVSLGFVLRTEPIKNSQI